MNTLITQIFFALLILTTLLTLYQLLNLHKLRKRISLEFAELAFAEEEEPAPFTSELPWEAKRSLYILFRIRELRESVRQRLKARATAYSYHGLIRQLNEETDEQKVDSYLLEKNEECVRKAYEEFYTPLFTSSVSEPWDTGLGISVSTDIARVIRDLENEFAFFNFLHVTPERVTQICTIHKLDIQYVKSSVLNGFSSALAVYDTTTSREKSDIKGVIFVDETLPRYRQGFLILHELGHFFAGYRASSEATTPEAQEINETVAWVRAERDAILFSLIASYPTPVIHRAEETWLQLPDRKPTDRCEDYLVEYLINYANQRYLEFGLEIDRLGTLRDSFLRNIRTRVNYYLKREKLHFDDMKCMFPDVILEKDSVSGMMKLYLDRPHVLVGYDLVITECNDSFAKMVGFTSKAELENVSLLNVIHEESRDYVLEQMKLRQKPLGSWYWVGYNVRGSENIAVALVRAWPVISDNRDQRGDILYSSFAILQERRQLHARCSC